MQQHLAARQENSGLQLGAPVIPCVRAHPAPQYGPGEAEAFPAPQGLLGNCCSRPLPCPPLPEKERALTAVLTEALNRSRLLLSPTSLGVTPTPQDKNRGHRGGEMLSA